MIATDLMLGDWVYIRRPSKKREKAMVTSVIGDHTIEAKTREGLYVIEDYAVDPILLSGDILVKNGFLCRDFVPWGKIYTYKWSIERWDNEKGCEHYFNLTPARKKFREFYWIQEMSAVPALCIRYVLELQHVMRLCGIKKEIEL